MLACLSQGALPLETMDLDVGMGKVDLYISNT